MACVQFTCEVVVFYCLYHLQVGVYKVVEEEEKKKSYFLERLQEILNRRKYVNSSAQLPRQKPSFNNYTTCSSHLFDGFWIDIYFVYFPCCLQPVIEWHQLILCFPFILATCGSNMLCVPSSVFSSSCDWHICPLPIALQATATLLCPQSAVLFSPRSVSGTPKFKLGLRVYWLSFLSRCHVNAPVLFGQKATLQSPVKQGVTKSNTWLRWSAERHTHRMFPIWKEGKLCKAASLYSV